MKFMVSRTSNWDAEVSPCEEAHREEYTSIDERTTDDPSFEPTWYDHGTNHRVEDGHIKRDFSDVGWFVELDSLEALMEFRDKYERLVLGRYWDNNSIPSIEIYDDYRE